MNVVSIEARRKVEGLSPELIPAELVSKPTHLQCGSCGFSGEVGYYVSTDEPWCFEPVCDCPLPAVLKA